MKPIKDALKEIQSNGNGHPDGTDTAAVAAAAIAKMEADKQPEVKYPLDAFPKPLQGIIQCWVDCYQLPPEYYATSVLAAVSALTGNAFRVEYKLFQTETPIIYAAIVGAPGIGKTPAIKFAIKSVLDKEERLDREWKEAHEEWRKECFKNAHRKVKAPNPPEPVRREVLLNDTTVEAISQSLPNNPRGLLSYRDELLAWFKSMNAYKASGADLEVWLSIWSNTSMKINRVGKPPLFIRRPFVSVIGGIQPGVLHKLTDNNNIDNGFLSRILFAYPDNQDIPPETDIFPDISVFDHYREILDNVQKLPLQEDGEPITLKLHEKAKAHYKAYREQIRLQCNAEENEAIRSLHIKMNAYVLRLALLLELMEFACAEPGFFKNANIAKSTVSLASIERAIRLCGYYTASALKILQRFESPIQTLNARNKALYEELPPIVRTSVAIEVGEKLKMSPSTVKRLIYNQVFFKQMPDGSYRKKFT
ncbi:MAG: DUF3987 domain-containing protein [Saprospiraceae bacterium]